jgi:BlaI family transcriptional regulator, penicillinase repressor
MARPKHAIPTPTEQKALNFLYERGSASVREYFEQGESVKGNAYTSVMSLLNTMFEKGLVTRTQEGRAFRYKPAMSQADNRAAVVANVLENVFEGDLEAFKAAVAGLKAGKRK